MSRQADGTSSVCVSVLCVHTCSFLSVGADSVAVVRAPALADTIPNKAT